MTQLSDHDKSILRAMSDDKQIQRNRIDGWFNISPGEALGCLQGSPNSLRIAPETRTINGVTLAAPAPDGGWALYVGHRCFAWFTAEDRDAARQAIIDALEGWTK